MREMLEQLVHLSGVCGVIRYLVGGVMTSQNCGHKECAEIRRKFQRFILLSSTGIPPERERGIGCTP